jgi:hypothetical protein
MVRGCIGCCRECIGWEVIYPGMQAAQQLCSYRKSGFARSFFSTGNMPCWCRLLISSAAAVVKIGLAGAVCCSLHTGMLVPRGLGQDCFGSDCLGGNLVTPCFYKVQRSAADAAIPAAMLRICILPVTTALHHHNNISLSDLTAFEKQYRCSLVQRVW